MKSFIFCLRFTILILTVSLFAYELVKADEAVDDLVQNDAALHCVERVMLHSGDADKALNECLISKDQVASQDEVENELQDSAMTALKQDPFGGRRRRRSFRRRSFRRRSFRRRSFRRRSFRRRSFRRRSFRRRSIRRRSFRRRSFRRRSFRRRSFRRRSFRRRSFRRRSFRRRSFRRRSVRRRSFRRRSFRRRSGTRRRTGNFVPNGCSIPGNLPFFYKSTFRPACNQHDICYYYKRASRLGCDNRFFSNMTNICRRRARSWLGKLTYRNCVKFAIVYYAAVRAGGRSHYG